MSLESKVNRLIDRSAQLKAVRSFFDKRCVLEVDTPLLTEHPNLDTHIELFQATDGKKKRYLHTSPEFGMKRLLAALKKDIYQLSHVFRALELGSKHNPEFMMIEYYRIGKNLDFLIDETLDLIFHFIPKCEIHRTSYFELFYHFTKIDLREENEPVLDRFLSDQSIDTPAGLNFFEKVDLIFSFSIEPHLKDITVIEGFPHWQKALAKLDFVNGTSIARRFEIYFNHIELANGYDELLDPIEQQQRFQEVLDERDLFKKAPYSIDNRFIEVLAQIPECVGVAIGFDRLMMIRHQAKTIKEVIPFDYTEI